MHPEESIGLQHIVSAAERTIAKTFLSKVIFIRKK